MQHETNHLGQSIGLAVPDWQPPAAASANRSLEGIAESSLCIQRDAESFYAASREDREGRNWTYLPYGPFDDFASFFTWLSDIARPSDPLFFAIVENASDRAVGLASYLRIDPRNGSIEVGHLNFTPILQKTPAATEAMYLMMEQAFRLGYRRYEWKCDALNAPSRRAAQRLGLSFEGIFRQATIYKGRNRDSAWYAVIDREWPELKAAFLKWLEPSNFNTNGQQKVALSALTAPILK